MKEKLTDILQITLSFVLVFGIGGAIIAGLFKLGFFGLDKWADHSNEKIELQCTDFQYKSAWEENNGYAMELKAKWLGDTIKCTFYDSSVKIEFAEDVREEVHVLDYMNDNDIKQFISHPQPQTAYYMQQLSNYNVICGFQKNLFGFISSATIYMRDGYSLKTITFKK